MSILSACMYVYHAHAVPMEARKGLQSPLELELRTVGSCHVGAGNKPGFLEGLSAIFM